MDLQENTVLFAGYQASGTLGRIIYDGAKEVKIFGEDIDVKAEIRLLDGISGHADQNGLIAWLSSAVRKPQYVFVNHGDEESCTGFAKLVTEKFQIPAMAPFSGSEFDLISGEWIRLTDPVYRKRESMPAASDSRNKAKASAYNDLLDALKDLNEYAARLKGLSNGELRKLTEKIRTLMD